MSLNIENPRRLPDGSIACVADHPTEGRINIQVAVEPDTAFGKSLRAELDKMPDIPDFDPMPLDARKARAIQLLEREISEARAQVAGTHDPVKMAEYADKASAAQAIIDGGGTPAQRAEAAAEAARLGLASAEDAAAVWMAKAEALRGARATVNAFVSDAKTRINATGSVEALEAEVEALRAEGEAGLAALRGENG